MKNKTSKKDLLVIITGFENLLDLEKKRVDKVKIADKANTDLIKHDRKIALIRKKLREYVDKHGELHLDIAENIYRISPMEDSPDIRINNIVIECKRDTLSE